MNGASQERGGRTPSDAASAYHCVTCRAALRAAANAMRCASCGATYPIICGVPIFVEGAHRYLQRSGELLGDARARVEDRAERLEEIWKEDELPRAGLERLRLVTEAERASLKEFEELLEPADAYLRSHREDDRRAPSLTDAPLEDVGWRVDALLPYLLRDWECDDELRAAEGLIAAAIEQHLPNRHGASLLVPGCGAGGLLRRPLSGFARVVGLDLSLPILLAVQRLLDGGDVTLRLPVTSASGIRIVETVIRDGAVGDSRRVELIASDACNTPFPDRSIDCVVTRFLLDIVYDPRRLAQEIHRILADGGVWINFGPANSPEAIWYFDRAEATSFLETAGFAPLEMSVHRVTHLDRRQLDPLISFESHALHLFAARKHAGATWRGPEPRSIGCVASAVPVHLPGAELVWRQPLGVGSESPPRTTVLEQETVKGLYRRFEIGDAIADALRLVDGERTVREVVALLKEQDPSIDADDAIEAFNHYFQAGVVAQKGTFSK